MEVLVGSEQVIPKRHQISIVSCILPVVEVVVFGLVFHGPNMSQVNGELISRVHRDGAQVVEVEVSIDVYEMHSALDRPNGQKERQIVP